MKEPLKDAFFQPANHPYFVKEKPFWTIDRAAAAGAQKPPARADSSALASDSSCNIFRCESSRTGSVSLSLPSAPSSSLQLSAVHDHLTAATAADAYPADEGDIDVSAAGVTAAAAVLPDGRRTPCAPLASGDAGRFLIEQHGGTGGAGVVINAATCPNLCRHASFLTDSLNRKNLLGGYFDADYDESSCAPEVPSGASRRRRLRRRSDSLRCDSTGSSAGRYGDGGASCAEPPEGSSESDGQPSPATAAAALESAPVSASSGGRATATTLATVADGVDVCSICSSSSDGSGNAADVIQPVALKLHLADEVREDVTKMASSLTRRLFFARPKQHEDVPAVPAVTLYHRDSDRSHLNVQVRGRVSEVQRSASVPRCSTAAPRSRERMRPAGHAASVTNHRSRQLESLPSNSSSLSPTAVTGRPPDRDLPWVTSASRSNLAGGLSAGARFSSGSSSSVFMTALEQLSIDDPSAQSERHERKRRRCRRRCCRAAIACAVLAIVGTVVAVVATLNALGLLSSDAVGFGSTRAPTTLAATTISPATSTPSAKSVTITFVGALRLMMDFLPEMTDINSTASRNLSKLFCSAVDRIYYNSSDSLMYDPLNGCQVTNLTSGSIIFSFILILRVDTGRVDAERISNTAVSNAIFEKLMMDYGWSITNVTVQLVNYMPVAPSALPSTRILPTTSTPLPVTPWTLPSTSAFATVGGCHPVSAAPSNANCRSFSVSYSYMDAGQSITFAQSSQQQFSMVCVCPDEHYNATDDSCERVSFCSDPSAMDQIDNSVHCQQGCENVYVRCRQIGNCNVFVSSTCCDSRNGNCSRELCSTTCKQNLSMTGLDSGSSINLGCQR